MRYAQAMPDDTIILAHGGGGELTRQLLDGHIFPRLDNDLLAPRGDSAILPPRSGRLCMTTDSFVVQPLRFPGGDIGKLAVAGTVNDVAMAGAKPIALSLALVIEEGLAIAELEAVIDSIAETARTASVPIATGDTKVIERRSPAEPNLIINTTGLGELLPAAHIDTARIKPGDAILINGPIAEHGLAVMAAREDLALTTELRSDVAPLNELVERLFSAGVDVKFLRDPTRGGLAGLAVDLAEQIGRTIELREGDIPITPAARRTADLLGLDPLSVANEGKVVAVVPADQAPAALAAWAEDDLGRAAAIIGTISHDTTPIVELHTTAGGHRRVTRPYGEELPRIC
jgi:hydrogenase expression/formation protein HypE